MIFSYRRALNIAIVIAFIALHTNQPAAFTDYWIKWDKVTKGKYAKKMSVTYS